MLSLASQLRQAGRVPEAIAAYEKLLALRPELPDCWFNLAWLQRRARRYADALASYQQALDRGVGGAEEVHLNRAVIFSENLARIDEAERELAAALALNPRYVPALLNLANLFEDRGERELARGAYERALAAEPGNALALSRLPQVTAVTSPQDPLIERLRQAIARPGASAAECADLGFGLGKALDDAAAYDEAFAAYAQANHASRQSAGPQGVRYDAAAYEQLVDRLIAAYPNPTPSAAPGDTRPAPIFICGMYRSGSTLVERMLAGHPRVTAGGELDLLPALARQHPALLGEPPGGVDAATAQRLRALYLEGISSLFPDAEIVTDKRPDNFLLVGLIKTLFPEARIVHTRRNAIDNCLSVYFLHLSHSMPYALDLLDTAHWYRQHDRLMAHWQSLYGESIQEVSYDALVTEPEPVVRRLLAHCDLPWDDACLAFHAARAVVRTASVWQVRQPLYTRSSGRWRHYERHLAGLREALEPL